MKKSFPVQSGVSGRGRKGRFIRKRSAEERQRLLTLFERSGQSLKQFSREHEVALSTLTFWRRRARERAPRKLEGTLVEVPSIMAGRTVHLRSAVPYAPEAVQIRLPNCVELNVSAGTDSRWVGALVRELIA